MAETQPHPGGLSGRVLVVDDARFVRATIAHALRDAGCAVDEASGGVHALTLLRAGTYDVVITDLKMPDVDGFSVLEAAKAHDGDVEVLLLTGAYAEDSNVIVRALRLGANDFMGKSDFGPEKVVWSVERALERRRQRNDLRASEARYRQLLERVQAIVWRARIPSLTFSFVSPEAEHILGYPARMWLEDGGFWREHLHPEDRDATLSRCQQAIGDQGDLELEYRMIARSGRTVWLQDFIRVVTENGQPKELVGVMIDITRRKLLEEEVRQAQKMEAFGQLAGGVAHDFNNILGVILGSTDILLGGVAAADPRCGRVAEIRDAAERGAALTRQLLAFSRKQVLRPRVVDLGTVVSGIEPMLRRLIGEDIQLEAAREDHQRPIYADSGQLEQIILNFAINARDAMPTGGRLVIATANADLDNAYAVLHPGVQPGRYASLSVSDTGVGMDCATIAHVFEPFFTTKAPGKGTGLGLATVYGIVQQSGGHIAVYSEPGRGSTFKVYLPEASECPAQEEPMRPTRSRDAAPRGAGETVLVVEDDGAMREITRDLLEEAGYAVFEAASPGRAISLARRHGGLDLLLSDVVLPDMPGPELARRVRAFSPRIRVLFMSGYPAQVVGHHELLEPGTPFLEKPFSAGALMRIVRQTLDGPQAAGSPQELEPHPPGLAARIVREGRRDLHDGESVPSELPSQVRPPDDELEERALAVDP
jgi:two-component system cell cycle sensor histidine kinase/response regulator CckA